MAWYDDNSQFNYGKHKGKKVKEVDDANYISWLHHSHKNVYFTDEVLNRLSIKNKGLKRKSKYHNRSR